MSRLMSVSLTEQAVVERRKTVTRRLGWRFLKAGDRLTLCRKVMGRKPGVPLVRLAEVEVISVRRESLVLITDEDVQRECVPSVLFAVNDHEASCPECRPASWAGWYARTMGCGLVEATIGFEPMHRGFAVRYPYPSGVSATLRSGSLRGGLPMVLVCGLVCA